MFGKIRKLNINDFISIDNKKVNNIESQDFKITSVKIFSSDDIEIAIIDLNLYSLFISSIEEEINAYFCEIYSENKKSKHFKDGEFAEQISLKKQNFDIMEDGCLYDLNVEKDDSKSEEHYASIAIYSTIKKSFNNMLALEKLGDYVRTYYGFKIKDKQIIF